MLQYTWSLSLTEITLLCLSVGIILSKPIVFLACRALGHRAIPSLAHILAQQATLAALFVTTSFACEYFAVWFWNIHPTPLHLSMLPGLIINTLQVIRSALSIWLIIKVSNSLYQWLQLETQDTKRWPFLAALTPQLQHSLKFILLAASLSILVPDFLYTPHSSFIINKLSALFLIWSVAYFGIKVISALETFTLRRYTSFETTDFRARRVFTQARVFRKTAIVAIVFLAIAISLTTFESVRALGTSILASAGAAGIVLGIAAQRSLSNLFAGLQIAITQPIKINDALIVENEYGTVEEISLSYVVVKLWDLRRLIIPINYFLEKPFQNWTRSSTSLLAPAMVYVDHSLPVEPVRQELMRILKASPNWDGVVAALQVTDATEHTMQLRALGSAVSAPIAFNLKCEMREKLIAFISKHYPHCLPKVRQENFSGHREHKTLKEDKLAFIE